MRCLRCGKETETESVFCEECLTDMEKHPVSPGTPVILPVHTPQAAKAAPVRRRRPEDEIKLLRKRLHRVSILLAAAVAIAALLGLLLFQQSRNKNDSGPIGQNYSTTDTTTAPLPGSVAG